ncbi:hypothetical protein QJS66_05040 [Kocuria rhizophila]|nr:hypothetical protein QJS66_05040 [Kocuria rhizophila]
MHFTVQFAGNAFADVGPTRTCRRRGWIRGRPAAVMTVYVVFNVVVAPVIGRLSARSPTTAPGWCWPAARSARAGWAVLLLWPGRLPLAVVSTGVCA